MSEEEKEAIKDTKDILKELNKNIDKDFIGRLYYKNKPIEDILQILLNLIEKQQKEIETLKESQFVLYGDDGNIVGCIRLGNDVISKDKIKEKIKYYHKQREKAETKKINDMYVNYIDCLEELLNETNE